MTIRETGEVCKGGKRSFAASAKCCFTFTTPDLHVSHRLAVRGYSVQKRNFWCCYIDDCDVDQAGEDH